MKKIILFIAIFQFLIIYSQKKVLFGTMSSGGINSSGLIFYYDPSTNIYTKTFDFNHNTIGGAPTSSLMQASDGKLYGIFNSKISGDNGSLFSYDPQTNIFIKKFDFDGSVNGSYPIGASMQASNGLLYGVTNWGGTNGKGVLFSYDPINNIFAKKYDFDNSSNGISPGAHLVQAPNGLLYGMTVGNDSLFSYNIENNVFTKEVLFPLETSTVSMGYSPVGNLTLSADGLLYGHLYSGGNYGNGTLFSYNPATKNFTKKINYAPDNNPVNGQHPYSDILKASNGLFYGITRYGGEIGFGVLFSYNPSTNIYTKKVDLSLAHGGGQISFGNLTQSSNGIIYGLTTFGGTNNSGILFSYDPSNNTYQKRLDFDATTGNYPYGGLLEVTIQNLSTDNNDEPSNLAIYPNPVKDYLNISEKVSDVKIINISGVAVKQFNDQNEISYNVSNLAKGIYIFTATTKSGKILNEKFIKE